MRRTQTVFVSRGHVNIEYQLGYNPYRIDPLATSGQISLFGPAPAQQNDGPGGAVGAIGGVDVIGAVEGADAANDIVDLASDCCIIH
jgi:hypothetical protein